MIFFIALFSPLTLADSPEKSVSEKAASVIPAFVATKINAAASAQARTWMDQLNKIAEKNGKELGGEAKVTAFDVLYKRAQHLEKLKFLKLDQITPQVLWIKSEDGTSLSEALKGISESAEKINALYIKDAVIEGDDSMDAFAEQMGKILAAGEGKAVLIFDHVQGSTEMMEEFVRFLKDITDGDVTSVIVDQEDQLETLNPLIQNMVEVMDVRRSACEKNLKGEADGAPAVSTP